MDKRISYKAEQMGKMLETLYKAIVLYREYITKTPSIEHHTNSILLACQDSVIQRFEYTIDGFWKFLSMHLEVDLGMTLQEKGPKPIIRMAVLAGAISELEAEGLMKLINERNKTSHIYHEEIADAVAKQAPEACKLMKTIFDRLQK
ncbi:MAG: hypothetical protein QG604_290 [Candidatus Dependentiae bacterium]|nr:hypothetical protein [Candidatus Dependentiae bacterium]